MENRVIKSSLLYILKMKSQLHKISFCWFLILPIQALFVIFSSIQFNIKHSNNNPIQAVLINIWDKIASEDTLVSIFVLCFVCSFIIIAIFIIFVFFKKPLNQFDRKAIYLDKLVTFSSFFVIIFQLFLFPIVWYFKQIVYNPSVKVKTFEFCMFPFLIISIIFVGFINHRIRIMNAYFPILFFFTGSEVPLEYGASIIGLCICSYAIKQGQIHKFLEIRNHSITKTIHSILFSFFMWKFINSFKFSLQKSQNEYVALLYLCVIMFLGMIIGFLTFISKVNKKLPPVIQLCECLQNLESNPKDNQSKMIALKISSQYFKTLTNSQITKIDQEQYQQIEHLCTGKNNEWKLQDWRKMINIMINQQYEKEKSLKLGIDLIQCRLMIKDQRLFDTIVFMKNLIITYKDQNWNSQYELFKIAFHIEDLYFKKYKFNSNSIIHILCQVDRLSNKFYKLCGLQIQYIYRFWSAVTTHKMNLEKQDDPDAKQLSHQKMKNLKKQFFCSNQVQMEMETFIIYIHEGIQKLQKILTRIQELSIANRQQRVLDYIKFLTTYTYEHNGNFSDKLDLQKHNDQIRVSGSELKEDYSQYLEIVDLKITRISLKLATELHYKKTQVVQQKIDFLIPKSYIQDIQQTIMGYNQPVYKVPHLVPLICSDNSIILKSFTSYLELDCDFGYRLLFHIQNNEINKDPIIIYNTMSNTIQYYNQQFINAFKIDKNKIDAKIRNKYLNPDEVFLDIQLSDKAIQHKLQDSRFQAEYNCRMFTSKIGVKRGGPKMENIRLSLVQKQRGNMILKVLKGHRMKSMMGQIEESENKMVRSNSSSSFFSIFQYDLESPLGRKERKGSYLYKNQNEDQQIFCKIENPYESKISNKKAQLSKSNEITLKFYAVLTIFLAMILLVSQGFSFLHTNNVIDDTFQTKIELKLKQIDMHIRLMEAYQNYYEYALVKIHKAQLSHIFGSYQKLVQKFSSEIEQKITKFQKQYLTYLIVPSRQDLIIPYSLKFQHYTIQTDTSATNLFDIAQNLLRYQNDQKALKFVFQNYKEFGSLITNVTERHNLKSYSPDQIYIIYYVTSGTIFFFSMCSLIVSLFLSYMIGAVRAQIQYIFRLMKLKNLESTFSGLNSLRQKINQIRQEGIKEQKKLDRLMKFCLYDYQQRKIEKLQSKSIRTHSQQLPQIMYTSSISPALSPDQTPRKPHNSSPPYMSPLKSPSQSQRGENLLKSITFQEENQQQKEAKVLDETNLKQNTDEVQQLEKKPIKIRNLGFFGYFSVIGIILLTVLLQIELFSEKLYAQELITNFKLENKEIAQNTIHQILDAQNYIMNYYVTINNSLNATFVQEYFAKFNLFTEKLTVNNFKLPAKFFNSLDDIFFKKMTANLCDNFSSKNMSFSQTVCYQVFNGIFQFGVTKTIEQLNSNILSKTRSNSWFTLSPHGNFSNFQQILYAEQIILKAIRQIQVEIKEYQNVFAESMWQKKIFIFVFGCALSIGRLVLSFFIKNYIYKASKIGIGYFLIIPKQVLLQNEIVDHLRKNDILNRISKI